MNSDIKKKRNLFIRLAAGVLSVVLMTLTAELLGEYEIIFPELAALSLGAVISERMPWRVSAVQMAVLMSIGAFMGWGLASVSFIPIFIRIMAGFLVCSVILIISGSTMLPMLSACILPVLTNAESILYPLSVIILTSEIIFIRFILIRTGIIKEFPDNEKHLSFGEEFGRLFFVTAVLAAVTAAAIFGGWTYMIAPPLIAAFSEISYPDSPAGKKPIILIFSVISCALCGTVSRLVLCEVTGLPLCIGVLAAAAAAYGLLMLFELPFPPAAALAVLPFILSEDVLGAYPFQAAAGIIIFTAAAVLYARIRVGHGSGGKKESDLLL